MNGLSTSTRNHHMMKVLRVSREAVEEAAEVVKNGGLVVYPTDTVYGLGCNPFDKDAVRRLINAKKRRGKPLPIAVPTLEAAERVARFNDAARRIAEAFWPGAVTIVLAVSYTHLRAHETSVLDDFSGLFDGFSAYSQNLHHVMVAGGRG